MGRETLKVLGRNKESRKIVNTTTEAKVVSVKGGKVHWRLSAISLDFPACQTGGQMRRMTRYQPTSAPVTCEKCLANRPSAASPSRREAAVEVVREGRRAYEFSADGKLVGSVDVIQINGDTAMVTTLTSLRYVPVTTLSASSTQAPHGI